MLNKIILNFDRFLIENPNVSPTFENKNLNHIFENLKSQLDRAKVNKHFSVARKNLEPIDLEVIALVKGKEHLLFKGNRNDFHSQLLEEFSDKFHYHLRSFDLNGEKGEFVRRIPKEEFSTMMDTVEASRKATPQEIQALRSACWNHPIFQEKDWLGMALKAFMENKLDRNAISTLCLYDSLKNNYPEVQDFFLKDESGNIDLRAFKLLKKGLHRYFQDLGSQRAGLSLSKEEKLLNELAKLKREETCFFLVPAVTCPDTIFVGRENMVLSPALLKSVLKARFKNFAFKPNPVLGFSVRDDFAHKTRRDLFIPCRYVSTPNLVPDEPFDLIYIYQHDCSHLLRDSNNKIVPLLLRSAACLEQEGLFEEMDDTLDRDIPPSSSKKLEQLKELIDSPFKKEKVLQVFVKQVFEEVKDQEILFNSLIQTEIFYKKIRQILVNENNFEDIQKIDKAHSAPQANIFFTNPHSPIPVKLTKAESSITKEHCMTILEEAEGQSDEGYKNVVMEIYEMIKNQPFFIPLVEENKKFGQTLFDTLASQKRYAEIRKFA